MSGGLNLGDARAWVDRATENIDRLEVAQREWAESRGVFLVGHRNPEFVRWEFDVAITHEPSTNLSILGGEIFDALRRALDYVAWQVYVTGTAERSERLDRNIYFPIVTEPADWEQRLQSKVPGASNDCAAALRASQPFAQTADYRAALPTLGAFINRDKHRRLSLFATGAVSVSQTAPDLSNHKDVSMIVAMVRPIPTFHVTEALRAAKESNGGVPAGMSWMVAFSELRRRADAADAEVGQQVDIGDRYLTRIRQSWKWVSRRRTVT
jgi:hypothetical protein